jgi:hypothetical protein
MGKRQIRIYRNAIPDYLPELKAQASVQVVLCTRVVLQGRLQSADESTFELVDGRRHTHTIPVQEVEEVIYDVEAPF